LPPSRAYAPTRGPEQRSCRELGLPLIAGGLEDRLCPAGAGAVALEMIDGHYFRA
jgi:hypothetical protein